MSGPILSNALADLAERVRATVEAQAEAERSSAVKALDAGEMLLQARAETSHGAWGAFLERARVHERQARRLMRLARSGIKPDTVSDLGGVKATLAWMRGLSLPDDQCALLAQTRDHVPGHPFAVVVPALGGASYGIARVENEGEVIGFRKPITTYGAFPVLLALMSDCLPALTFLTVDDADGFFRDLVRGEGLFVAEASPGPGNAP